jgi:predicted nucleotidyltransferase
MRISQMYIEVIKKSILSLDKKAKIFLFGSRVDDKKKGGDIDILVVSDKLSVSDKWKIKKEIFKHIEEQKIDIVIAKNKDLNQPFNKIALSNAILL